MPERLACTTKMSAIYRSGSRPEMLGGGAEAGLAWIETLKASSSEALKTLSSETPKAPRIEMPKAWRGREMGRGCPLPSRLEGLGERRKLPQRGPERSSDQKRILVYFEVEKLVPYGH